MEARTEAGGRLPREQYYMGIAIAVRRRANCLGSRVGALLVREDRVIASGYNGTPADMQNCEEGGCQRCANRALFGSGQAYDLCICVHAEQNALLTAARFGISVDGSTLYTTMRPCFGCTKELLQAGVRRVYFLHDWSPKQEWQPEYALIQQRFPEGIRWLEMADLEEDWGRTPSSMPPAEVSRLVPDQEPE